MIDKNWSIDYLRNRLIESTIDSCVKKEVSKRVSQKLVNKLTKKVVQLNRKNRFLFHLKILKTSSL